MTRGTFLRSLFNRDANHNQKLSRPRRLFVESLERRALLTTLLVDIGDPGCSATGPIYCQIHQAESVAVSGDEIEVESGIYQPFTIDVDNISVEAANNNSTAVVDGGGVAAQAVKVDADGVTIKGIVATNADAGFVITGSSNTLEDNTAQDNVVNGFSLEGGGDNTLKENLSVANSRGIQLTLSDNNTLTKNELVDNVFQGVELDRSNGNTLVDNEAVGNGVGIRLINSDNNLVDDNQATGNSGVGILVQSSSDNLVKGNRSKGNGGDGFLLQFSLNNELTKNKAEQNGGNGFELYFSLFNSLSQNTAKDSDGNGFELVFADDNTLTKNTAKDNDGNGIQVSVGIQVDAASSNNVLVKNKCKGNALGDSDPAGLC